MDQIGVLCPKAMDHGIGCPETALCSQVIDLNKESHSRSTDIIWGA